MSSIETQAVDWKPRPATITALPTSDRLSEGENRSKATGTCSCPLIMLVSSPEAVTHFIMDTEAER